VRPRSFIITIIVGLLLVTGCSSSASADTLVSIGAGLEGPAGTTATQYASGLKNVSALVFDSHGRLWVATAGYDDDGTDAIYVVTEAGATPTKVVSGLHTPLGLLWYHDALYVASKARVDTYSDFDGTAFATQTKIVTLPSGVGDSNQLILSPDGRIVMGISASCDHCVTTAKYDATIVSFEPDGTDLQVYAKRVRAAIGLAYYPGTSDLFATLNQRDDLGDDTPGDSLALVNEGDDWGFPTCYGQSGTACASVPTAIAELDKHSAVSGVAIVTGQLGEEVGTAAVVAEWADGKVQRVALTKSGAATYTATVHPFLTGFKNPVPVLLSASGALLVGDWTTGVVYAITSR
jgi:glucose/arabinose dehydrogenase